MRVLIIDDEDGLRKVIRRMLEPAGHQVSEANNGRAGLVEFQKQPFDAVVTDIIMPDKEGIETITDIRKINRNVRIVAVSGGGRVKNLDFLKIALQMGADAALPKPFLKEDLLACIDGRSTGPANA